MDPGLTCRLRWSDADVNGHVRHTVYPDLGAEARLAWWVGGGFGWDRFQELRLGPVLLREEIDYLRELGLGETVRVSLEVLGHSADGGRWKVRHEIRRADGEVAARLVVLGGWLDLDTRRLRAAPGPLLEFLRRSPRAPEFAELPSLRRRDG